MKPDPTASRTKTPLYRAVKVLANYFLPLICLCLILVSAAMAGPLSRATQFFNPTISNESALAPSTNVPVESQVLAAPAPQRYRIAVLLPLSGPQAPLGQALLNAAVMALFDAGDGRLALIPYDTAGRADQAANAANRAVSEGAQFILGPLFSAEIKSVSEAVGGAAPILSLSNDWTQAGGNVFIFGLTPQSEIAQLIASMQQRGTRILHVLANDGAYGKAVVDSARLAASSSAVKIGTVATYNTKTPQSLQQAIAKIIAALPRSGGEWELSTYHGILIGEVGPRLGVISTAFGEAGVSARDVAVAGTSQWMETDFSVLPDLQGAYYTSPPPPGLRQLESRYLSYYGVDAPALAALAYDGVRLAAVILPQQGPAGLFDALRRYPAFNGFSGMVRFAPDQTAERRLGIVEAAVTRPQNFIGN